MSDSKRLLISIICPVYNEEQAVGRFLVEINKIIAAGSEEFEIIFIDDGSDDGTVNEIRRYKKEYTFIRLIGLSRNFGKEAALTAGLHAARGDCVIPIDVDLQDPPELIPELISTWLKGYDTVVAKRVDRQSDGFFKRSSASLFYKVHNRLSTQKIPENVGDFRLIDRKIVDILSQLGERERFMKGLFSWVGFKTAEVPYQRNKRSSGGSRFNFWSLWRLALDGITGFSSVPLKVWTYVGISLAFVSFIYIGIIVCSVLLRGIDVPGYASILSVVLFLGGVQLIGIGVLGEYIGRIYLEVKGRPLYVVAFEE